MIITHRSLFGHMCHFDSFVVIWSAKPPKPCHCSPSYAPPRTIAVRLCHMPLWPLTHFHMPAMPHIMMMSLLAMPAALSTPCHPLWFCHVSYWSIYVIWLSWLGPTSPESDPWTFAGWSWTFGVDFDLLIWLLTKGKKKNLVGPILVFCVDSNFGLCFLIWNL